ncbi:S46 family peptidase [bacterium]|nr:S46 family peptidase [bacterium]
MKSFSLSIVLIICLLIYTPLIADEGMWTFDNLPLKLLKEKYGFEPSQEWIEHVRLSCVRINDGGSGSFVSPNGLVMTNQHVMRGQLQKLSTPENDYVKNGFYANSPADELKCPDVELNVLVSMDNVSEQVHNAAKNLNDQEGLKARAAEISKIQKESFDSTGLRSDVITLYQGGEYWLYRYKKYTDIRLVFAAEQQIAFYGGYLDNFTYPRYELDMALVRVYENGKPIESKHFLKWNSKGAVEGELVFVVGNPGSTDRMMTMAQLETQREIVLPMILKSIKRRLNVLKNYAASGSEQARQVVAAIAGTENGLKSITGEYNGLLDKDLMKQKQDDENKFRTAVNANAEWKKTYGSAWNDIAKAQKKYEEYFKIQRFRSVPNGSMANMALRLVRYASELTKADADRMNGYHDAQLESFKRSLQSTAPVYPELDEKLLINAFEESLELLGPKDLFVKTILNGRTPAEAASEIVNGTKLNDRDFRKSLIEGGPAAIDASNDPMLVFARKIDPILRESGTSFRDQIASVEVASGEKIGKARFAVYGKSMYPDATFTLRFAFGTVKGYPSNGTLAAPITTYYGLYDRALGFGLKEPFHLPARYMERKDKLDLSTPSNFATTCDIIGGNSGSPVINRNGEVVGLIHDGNMEGLVGNFIYNDETGRAVSDHSAGMIMALRKLYDADRIANELEGK